jgi:hypothetical protein
MSLWFVYRSHYEGPLSKRVVQLDAPSLLDWFQKLCQQARAAEDPNQLAKEVLGGHVYGFSSLLEAVKENALDPPKSIDELRELLDEHLYVEGEFVLDEHSLRVATDDDEVALAYFFFDDTAAARTDRVAWLLHQEPALPDGKSDTAFNAPVEVTAFEPAGRGPGRTWACLFTFTDGDSMPGTVGVFEGVRLPALTQHLSSVTPPAKPVKWSKEYVDSWPLELRLLRAYSSAPLADALARAGQSTLATLASSDHNTSRLGLVDVSTSAREFDELAAKLTHPGDPSRNIVAVGEHAALLCVHAHNAFGYQQWILFDDLWAAAHTALASSLLRYATDWDPFSG